MELGNATQCDTWGHSLHEINRTETFRIILQNPRSLRLFTDYIFTQYSFLICQSLAVGVLCLPETNVNWRHKEAHTKLQYLCKKAWDHLSCSTSFTKEDFKGINLPGGTATIVLDNWTSRLVDKGTDPFGLGRWSYITIRGPKEKKIHIITVYRICKQTIQSVGHTTVMVQQYRALSKKLQEANIVEDPAPRRQFILDVQSWLERELHQGIEILLGMDANELISNKQGSYCPLTSQLDTSITEKHHDGSFNTLMTTCGLIDPLLLQHTQETPRSTYSRGSQRIDNILISKGLHPAIKHSGILPYDGIFSSDHRACYLDLDAAKLFNKVTPNIQPRSRWSLQLQDPRIVENYYKHLKQQIDYHKFQTKIDNLHKAVMTKGQQQSMATSYETIDTLLTEGMRHAESKKRKQLSAKYQWSPTLKEAVLTVRYWHIRIRRAKGQITGLVTEQRLGEQLSIPDIDKNKLPVGEIVQRLREARTKLCICQTQHFELREEHLSQ